ncbi:MAG TPA: amylo-alpha-1,6-glucosidase, partial [Micromonosporaceae bacterium]
VLRWQLQVDDPRAVVVTPARETTWSRPIVGTDDPRLVRLLDRSLDDLRALRLAEANAPQEVFLGAGVPWYLTLFGRDSLWAARMMLPLGTGLAAGTLRTLARRQGRRIDPVSGEAPGKIMHELRREDVRLSDWGSLPATYYGTVDATLLWISLLADAWRWGMPDSTVAYLLPNLTRALFWLYRHGDPDGDGFVEYVDHSGRGLANQGWKDSGTAVRFHDGQLARPPIALCEVQGYAHRAALDAAELIDAFGEHTGWDRGAADRWREYAAALADRFRRRYWVDGPLGPYPAMALDGDGRQVDALTSNIGHLLGTGILSAEEETTVGRLLASAPLADGYGLRTMSTLDAGYAPLSYHCGSVWPHDTAIAILGLARAGAGSASAELISNVLAAAPAFGYRLPELYSGDRRADLPRPLPHPGACRPQAWSAAAAVTIVQALLGLDADVPRRQLRIRPLTGTRLGALRVHGLRVSDHPFTVDAGSDGQVRVSGLPAWLRLIGPDQQPATTAAPPASDDGRTRDGTHAGGEAPAADSAGRPDTRLG